MASHSVSLILYISMCSCAKASTTDLKSLKWNAKISNKLCIHDDDEHFNYFKFVKPHKKLSEASVFRVERQSYFIDIERTKMPPNKKKKSENVARSPISSRRANEMTTKWSTKGDWILLWVRIRINEWTNDRMNVRFIFLIEFQSFSIPSFTPFFHFNLHHFIRFFCRVKERATTSHP